MICRCGGQHDCLLIWRSEFESRRILQLFSVKFVFEEDENKQKEAGILKVLFAAHSMPKAEKKEKRFFRRRICRKLAEKSCQTRLRDSILKREFLDGIQFRTFLTISHFLVEIFGAAMLQ